LLFQEVGRSYTAKVWRFAIIMFCACASTLDGTYELSGTPQTCSSQIGPDRSAGTKLVIDGDTVTYGSDQPVSGAATDANVTYGSRGSAFAIVDGSPTTIYWTIDFTLTGGRNGLTGSGVFAEPDYVKCSYDLTAVPAP
jgi:hypothetical protein